VFTSLDIQLYPSFAKLWPSLSLDKLQAPVIGDSRGVAAFVERLLAGGTISPNQMLAVSKVLLHYQQESQINGEYSAAWMTLFLGMVAFGMQVHMCEIRRQCMSNTYPPLLTSEDEAELRSKLSAKIIPTFDATSPYTEVGAAAAAAECKRQNKMMDSVLNSHATRLNEDKKLVEAYNGIIASGKYSELTDVNPRVFAQCVRSIPNGTSAKRHAVLREVGHALIDSGNTVSAAFLSAHYDRVPDFLRTTAAVNALNDFYYPTADKH